YLYCLSSRVTLTKLTVNLDGLKIPLDGFQWVFQSLMPRYVWMEGKLSLLIVEYDAFEEDADYSDEDADSFFLQRHNVDNEWAESESDAELQHQEDLLAELFPDGGNSEGAEAAAVIARTRKELRTQAASRGLGNGVGDGNHENENDGEGGEKNGSDLSGSTNDAQERSHNHGNHHHAGAASAGSSAASSGRKLEGQGYATGVPAARQNNKNKDRRILSIIVCPGGGSIYAKIFGSLWPTHACNYPNENTGPGFKLGGNNFVTFVSSLILATDLVNSMVNRSITLPQQRFIREWLSKVRILYSRRRKATVVSMRIDARVHERENVDIDYYTGEIVD
ncbi:unnamed protein product, partial [Amoebophrya sp. A25]